MRETEEKNQRILVIGTSFSTKKITSYSWDEIPEDLNFADYTNVILNLSPLKDKEYLKKIDHQNFNAKGQSFHFLLFNPKSEIILIHSGNFSFEFKNVKHYFLSYFPFFPGIETKPGQTIDCIDQEFKFYFENVEHWENQLTSRTTKDKYPGINSDVAKWQYPGAINFLMEISPIAINVAGQPVSFSMRYYADIKTTQSTEFKKQVSGNFVYLPQSTKITNEESVKLILKERYSCSLESETPEWVDDYKTPDIEKVESELNKLNQKKEKVEADIKDFKKKLPNVNKYQKLLYTKGDELKDIVHDTLELLKAKVIRDENFQDDGRIIDPKGREGMLEVKGIDRKSAKRNDVRQVADWRDDAEENENYKSKGILIANAYKDIPITERDPTFPVNCIDRAVSEEIALIKTSQLFKAVCLFQSKKLDIEKFWDTIFSSNGVCNLPNL